MTNSVKAFDKTRIKQIIATLRQFRKDREQFIDACEKEVWKQFATSPHFYLQWAVANMSSDLAEDCAIYVLKHDKRYRWYDIADTIRAIYTDPEKWVQDNVWSLKKMFEVYGQPE